MEKTSKLTTKKLIAILAAIFVVCGLALGALVLTKDKVREVAAENEYTYVNPDETKAEADAGFTIDGVFDEAEYKKNTWLYLENTEGGANVDIAITSYFGQKGMYFAYDVDERNPVYVNLDRPAYLNSCIEMYLAPSYLSSLKGNSAFEIDMLPTGDLSFKKTNGKGGWVNVATTDDVMAYLGATTKGGAVNTPECKGYTLELFIPWTYMEQMGIDVDSIKDGYVYVNPAHITSFNETGTDTNIDRYHYWFAQQIGAGWNNVDAFFRFDTNGVQGSLPTVMEKGDSYTIEGAPDVIPGMKNTYTITPKEGQTFTSILVNGEEYIKDVSFTEEGVAILPIRGKLAGLKIEAKTEAVTEGNKTLNVTVASNKKGGDSLADVTITCKGPDGFEDVTLDAQGKFTIKNARQGFYTISAEKEGYKKVVRTVYLNRDMETNVTLDYDRFEVVSGTAWILDDQNKDLLYKFGGNNAVILSKDTYSDFAVESTLHYDTELAELSDKDNFVQQRQGYRFAFTNDKTWHVDILKEKDKFILQYAKFSGDKSMTNWQNVYTLTKDDIAKLQSKDGIKFEVQRSGRVVNFLLGGKVVANEYLAKEYANLKAKVGFESWIANRAVQEIPFSITAKKISASGVFKVSQGWDLSKQNQGVITAVGGSANNGKFTNWLETFFDNYRDIAVVAKDVKNNGEYSLIYKFEFNNGTVFYARIQNSEKEQIVQVMGQGNSFTEKWERVCKLSTSQIEKLTTDGIEFRVAIIDETAHFYLDGIEVGTRDLSKTSDGKASKIKNETATISVRMDGNVGETVSMAYKLNQVALDIPKARYGSITTDKTSYAAGDTIVITAKNSDGTPCTEIIIDGKTVKLDANGSYSFKAQAKGHTVEGIFKIKEIFANTDTWDLSKEQEGKLTVVGGNAGKGQSTAITTKDNCYREVALKAKLEKSSDKYSLIAFWNFTNGEKYIARISEENSRVIVQAMPTGNTFLEKDDWQMIAKLSNSQVEKLRTEGVELRMALVNETMHFFIDDVQVGTRDLSKTADGKDSKIAKETAQIQIRLDGNTGHKSEVEFELNKVAIINPVARYGTVTTDKASYAAGETVTLTAVNSDGTPCNEVIVDGKKVALDSEGKYSFKAKVQGHILEGIFKLKEIFEYTDTWDLSEEQEGILTVLGGNAGKGQSTAVTTKDDFYREVALKAKMEETEDLYSLIAFWKFTNGEKYVARLSHEIIKSGPRTIVQVLPIGNSFLEENNWSNTWVYTFTAAQEEKLKSEGVELRMALVDETMYFLLDGEQIGTRDLSKTIDGEPSNIAEETAQIQIRLDGNTDKESKVEFELNKVAIVNPASKYGTVTTDKASYEVGETVTVTAQNRDGSPCTKLMVDGKKESLDANGQYSFTVKAEGHALEGLFKEKDYFLSNDQWNLEDQGKGTVSVVGQENNTSNLVTKGNTYRGMTVNVRDNDADTKGFSAQMTFSFNNGEKLAVRLHNTDNDVNAYRVQLMDNTFVTAWTIVGSKLDNALVEKIRSEAGVDFTILIVEEEMRAYIDGKLWSSISLAKNLAGEDSNIMNETATVAFRIDKNTGYNNVVDFELYESAFNVIGDNRGTVQTNELGYLIDDKVTLTVKPETGYYCKSIKVDGKDVELSTDGTYSFEATKANYKVEAAFKKGLFKTNNEWNVINQHFGKLVVPATTDGNTNWLETTRSYTEIKAVAKYYAHTDYKNAPYGFVESFKFANNATVDIRITNSDNGTWRLKSMGGIYNWSDIYIFTDSEVKKLQGDGIEYKMVRKGTSLELWIDGRNVKTLDLTKNYKNEATGITADMDATARFCLFENKGYETEIPFELAGGPEKVTIDIKDTENGKITLAEDEYYMGDQVILKAEASKGYAYKSLKVDGKEVTLGWDGTYEFEVTKTEHEIEATFAKEIFVPNANWNLTNQNVGLVKASTTNSWLVTKDTYSVVTMKWQNQGAVNTGNRANYATYVRYYFTDATFIDIQILEWNGEYYLKSASKSSIYGENVEYWSTLEVSDIGQKIEGEGVELKIVQDGTKIMFYIDGVRLEMKGSFQEGASYIDLTKDANLNDNNKGIESNSKATIRFYNDYAANGERVHEFSVSNDVPTGVTFDVTKKENGTVVCNPNACLLGDEATIEVTPADKYYCSGLKVDGKDVIDDTTVNIDGTYIYKFKTTKNSYTVEPIYSEKKVTLDIETEGNGTVTYTDAYVGEQIKITVTGKKGYNYEQVLVDGKDITNQIGWDGTYTFTTSKLIHKVEADFKKGPWATTSSDWNLSKQNLNVLKTTYTGGSSTWLDAAGDYSEVAITVKDYSKGKGNFQAYVLFQFTVDGTLHTAGLRMYYESGFYKIGGTGDSHVFKWAYLKKITEQSIIDKIQGEGVEFKLVREGTMIRVYLDGVYQNANETRWDLTKYYGTTTATGITANTPTTRVTVVQCGNGGYDVEIPYKLTKVATIANNADERNGTVTLDKTSCNVGEKVTMTVTPNSGYYQDLKVNGEDVILDWDSMTYTFTAKETNTITGSFKSPEITEHNNGTEWDLRNQHKDLMAIQNFDASSNWMTMATGATDVDITLNARNYETTSQMKYTVRFYFTGLSKHVNFRLTYEDRWGIQSWNSDNVWGWVYTPLTDTELSALRSADGLDFRVKKIGTMVHFYLAGQLVGQKDLSDYNMGITESSPLTVYVMMEGNVGKDVVVPFSINDRLAELQSKIGNKNISFIGDSISTFRGYTNDVNRNSTTGWNAVYYPATNVTDVSDTWWMRTTNKAGLNLLVNNAWSGDKLVSRGLYRSTQLHNNDGVNPDIIAVYFGINDFDTGISVENFRKYYKRMVANMATRYPDADIFLMNYVPNKCNDRPVDDMLAYNQIVADMAEQYGGTVVDLYNRSGITQANCANYMHDNIALHPNKLGMAAMSEVLLDTMYNKYVK